jgi:exonuclease SbcC
MRILKLRLHNLNSLTGKWELDFTGPAFADGIFAITGPTGAGKTTILDALCLALYGSTPRLGKVTQSGNEIMSRQTGECTAEVEFSTESGAYRCSWSQHRTRKKPGGLLQPPKRELSLLTGQILADSVKEVEAKVEEITGMDAERFTRSMLLAQGKFDAFLQAPPDKRAPILEQITGTGLYSQISIRVHERCKAETDRQKQLQEQANALQLLASDEEAVLRQELIGLQAEEARLKTESKRLAEALAWLTKITELRQELAVISTKQEELAAEQHRFAEAGQRLAQAEQALPLEGSHASLAALRRQQEEDSREVALLRLHLPELESAVRQAEEVLHKSNVLLTEGKAAQEQGSVLLRQVRELDFRRQEKEAALKKQTEDCAALHRQNAAAQKEGERLEREVSQIATRQQHSLTYLSEHQTDERLLSDLTGLSHRLTQLDLLTKRLEAISTDCGYAEQRAVGAAQLWQDKAQRCLAAAQQLTEAQAQRAVLQQELDTLLQGRRTTEDLHQEQARLARLTELLRQHTTLAQERADLQTKQAQSTAARSELTANLDTLRRAREEAWRELERRRELAVLARRINALEQEREQLRDNCPCPLCGALEHPYAQGNIPPVDEFTQQEQLAGAAWQVAEQALNKAELEAVRLEQQEQHTTARLTEKSTAAQAAEQQIDQLCAELSLIAEQRQLATIEQRLHENRQLVKAAEERAEKISTLGSTLEQHQAEHLLAMQAQQQAAAERDKAELEQKRLTAEHRTLATELADNRRQIWHELAGYGLADAPLKGLTATLTARKEQWQQHQQQGQAAEQQLTALRTELKVLHAGMAARTEQLEAATLVMNDQQQELQRLSAERAALFAAKDADQEEQRLAEAVKRAEAAWQQAEEQHRHLSQRRDLLAAAINSKETALKSRTEPLLQLEADFAQRLHEYAFADETAWVAARLSQPQRAELRRQAEALRHRQTELTGQQHDRQARLASEEQVQLTTDQPAELRLAQDELISHCTRTVKKMGSVQQQLEANEQRRGVQQTLLRDLEAQKQECLRWKTLDSLIGSADGKKYRNFAQGLTFEQMLVHANQQLKRMNGRYLLTRDQQQPLELNVADFWQAGEVRSAKNLSGGESFVVSLALALGLSGMVGGKVRIESLFLDEGFGTLDDEALETALESLAELRREGRLIGVISHVAALKERISCRIKVLPSAGGQSTIKGPGVRRL